MRQKGKRDYLVNIHIYPFSVRIDNFDILYYIYQSVTLTFMVCKCIFIQ